MPLYEYECSVCGNRFERIQKFSDPLPDACPKCGKGPVRKLMSSPAIQFKGSGFYITDYARKDTGGTSKTGETKESGGSGGDKDGAAPKTETPAKTSAPAAETAAKTSEAKTTKE